MLADVIGDVKTIEEVIAAMRGIESALPDTDGVKWFNFLYRNVTEAVAAETTWRDWPFLQRFDVTFARLYFDAVISWERARARTPHSWRPLFACRYEAGRARIQFALAGMNAHINHDLALALDQMAADDGSFASRDSARYADFERVNDILERMEAALRDRLATGLSGEIDRALGDLDRILVRWKVRNAREAAWTNGEVLWHLHATPQLKRDYLEKLDRMTAFAGRGLLVPRLGIGA